MTAHLPKYLGEAVQYAGQGKADLSNVTASGDPEMSQPRIAIPQKQIEAFCKKWRVREFALFGSVLRDDFRPDSDIDVLVSFMEDPDIGLWDLSEMAEELEALYARKVDLVIKEGLNNPFRRKEILERRNFFYSA